MSSNFLRNSSSNDSLSPSTNVRNERGKNLSGITAATTVGARFEQSSNKSPLPSEPKFLSMAIGEMSPSLVDHRVGERVGYGLNKPQELLRDVPSDWDSMLVVRVMLIWCLPFLHLLDLANVKFAKADLSLVATSLKALFRRCSIHVATFSNGDSSTTAFVRCQTMDQVEFVIMFWEIDNMYCAELQRISGDKHTFWDHARRIMDIIQGKQTNLPTDDPLYFDREEAESHVYQMLGQRALGKDILCSPEDMKKAVENLIEFLVKGHYDKDGIVLESLESMTDPYMSGVKPACVAAEMVLDPNGRIFSRLLNLIQSMTEELYHYHAHKALRVLAKSIGLVDKMEREKVAATHPELVEWLRDVANKGNPHIAYCAVHMLSYFVNDGLVNGFEMEPHMKHIGSTSHAALEKACWRLANAVTSKSTN